MNISHAQTMYEDRAAHVPCAMYDIWLADIDERSSKQMDGPNDTCP